MRWKLLRRRLSISAPQMVVRSRLPWPFRWAPVALMVGLSAVFAILAFEFGRGMSGPDRSVDEELQRLRTEVVRLRDERDKTLSIGNTAESLIRTEKSVQDTLAQQLRQAESENSRMRSDLGFFEKLLPAAAGDGLTVRGLQAERSGPGGIRYQLLVMQSGRAQAEFRGRYDITLAGTLDGSPWHFVPPGGIKTIAMKQYMRVEGTVDYPPQAVVESVSVRVMDPNGVLKASLTVKP